MTEHHSTTHHEPAPRGHAGFVIVREAPPQADLIAPSGVSSQILLTSEHLFLKRELIEPGARGIRHFHETASIIVMLSGEVRVNYGSEFQFTDFAGPGEFIFIPAMLPHEPVNESTETPVECLVIRNAPWDEVFPYDEYAARLAGFGGAAREAVAA
jgi:uncharacterized RmlC-like cupin family protein